MVVRRGFAPAFVSLPRPLERALRVVLRQTSTIDGHIIGIADRRSGLAVLAENSDYGVPSQRCLPIGNVAEDDAFRITGLAQGIEWTLVPCVAVGREWKPAGGSVTVAAPATGIVLSLSQTYALRVRAIGPEGDPIPANVMSSLMPEATLATHDDPSCSQDDRGGVTWPRLTWPCGDDVSANVDLWLSADGYQNLALGKVRLSPGVLSDLGDAVMIPADPWQILVADATGRPIEGAMVRYFPEVTLPDAATRLPQDRAAAGDTPARADAEVDASQPDAPTHTVSGRVVDSDRRAVPGKPVSGALLSVSVGTPC